MVSWVWLLVAFVAGIGAAWGGLMFFAWLMSGKYD